MGKITKATLGVSRMFGYNEDELIGRPVKTLVPLPYSKQHGRSNTRYQATGRGKIIGRER